MLQHSPAMLVLRAALVLLVAVGLASAGVAIDRSAGTSPMGVLGALLVAVIFGTITIVVIIVSTFPRPPVASKDEKAAQDERDNRRQNLA